MGGDGDRGGRGSLERALAVRNQRRAQAAAQGAAQATRAPTDGAEAAALEAARRDLDALRLELSTLQARVEAATRAFEAAQARVAQRAPDGEAAREAERRAIDEIDRRLTERARAREAQGAAADPGRRAKARLEVPASILLDRGEQAVLCPLVDISLTGALFSTGGAVPEGLELGSEHAVTIVADHDAKLQVEVVGRIVRAVGDTFALDWSKHEESQLRLARLLDALSTPRAPSEEERRRAEIAEIEDRLDQLETEPAPTQPPLRRPNARVVVSASMLIDHGGRSEELVLQNVSRTGGLVASAGASLSKVRVGTLVLLTLARSDDPTVGVDLLARVVRHEGYATAVDWSEDHAAEYAVARFVDRLVAERQEP